MSKFLDETGLKALWAKIKAWASTSVGGRNLLKGTSMSTVWEMTYPKSDFMDYHCFGTTTQLDGNVYTLSFWAKSTVAGDRITTYFWAPNTTTKVYVNGSYFSNYSDGMCKVTLTTSWKKYRITYYQTDTNSKKNVYACRLFAGEGTGTISMKGAKFEEGEAATDWSPAPEDTVASATTASACSGNSSTATKLQTARTLTVGSTGKSFDGSGNVSWSLSEIGAAASSHTHTKSQITDFPSSLKNPNALVMQANGTQVGSYDGSSAVTVNITPSSIGAATSGHDHTTLNTAFKFNNNDISEVAGNLTGTATAHTINFYRNGFTIPYQMDNANDGGMLRVRGTSESNTILELATWDDSGAGETIEFNYYPTTSRVTPTYSVVVPKKSGTIALTSDIPSVATTSANGLMSSTDKSNLDRSIYDVQDNQSGDTYKLNFYSNGGSNNTEIEIPVATTSAAGLMSKGDKANLDGAVTTAVVSGGGNAITTASISGHTLTLTKGSTFSLSNHTHSQYLTSVPVATTSTLGGVKSTTIMAHMTNRDYYAEVGSDGKVCVNIPWTDTNTHYASSTIVNSASTSTSNTSTALTNGNVYLNHIENGSVKSSHKITGSGATTVTTDASGNITISSVNTNTDTKNTAGSTNTSSKIYLIGATSQEANPQTYSNSGCYVGTDGCLYSNGTKVLTAHQSLSSYMPKSGGTFTGSVTFNTTSYMLNALVMNNDCSIWMKDTNASNQLMVALTTGNEFKYAYGSYNLNSKTYLYGGSNIYFWLYGDKTVTIDSSAYVSATGFKASNSSNSYVLTGGGGTKLITDLGKGSSTQPVVLLAGYFSRPKYTSTQTEWTFTGFKRSEITFSATNNTLLGGCLGIRLCSTSTIKWGTAMVSCRQCFNASAASPASLYSYSSTEYTSENSHGAYWLYSYLTTASNSSYNLKGSLYIRAMAQADANNDSWKSLKEYWTGHTKGIASFNVVIYGYIA